MRSFRWSGDSGRLGSGSPSSPIGEQRVLLCAKASARAGPHCGVVRADARPSAKPRPVCRPVYWVAVETIALTPPLPAIILPVYDEGEAVEGEAGRL